MKKYILIVFVLIGLLFSVSSIHAQAVPSNQVRGIVEILKTLGIDNSKISEIKKILESDNIAPVYSPNTGQKIIEKPTVPTTGCENNYKFNIKTGQKCSGYKEPPKPTGGTQA